MNHLDEFRRGLQAIRKYLNEKYPGWLTVTVKVEIEPGHSRMEMTRLVEQTGERSYTVTIYPTANIDHFDVTFIVGTLEDYEKKQALMDEILKLSKKMEGLVEAAMRTPDQKMSSQFNEEANKIAHIILTRMSDELPFREVYDELLMTELLNANALRR